MTWTGEVQELWECDTWTITEPLIDSGSQNLLSITLDVLLQLPVGLPDILAIIDCLMM